MLPQERVPHIAASPRRRLRAVRTRAYLPAGKTQAKSQAARSAGVFSNDPAAGSQCGRPRLLTAEQTVVRVTLELVPKPVSEANAMITDTGR